MRKSVFFILFHFSILSVFSSEGESRLIYEKDLSQHLFYYDLLDHSLLPYVDSDNIEKTLYAPIIGLQNREAFLVFHTMNELILFLDGYLVKKYDANSKVSLDLCSVIFEDKKEHLFSFYSSSGVRFESGLWIVTKSEERFRQSAIEHNGGVVRLKELKKTHIYVMLVIVSVVLAYMRFIQSPYISAYFDITKFNSRVGVEEFIYMNPFTRHSLLILFLVSVFYAVGLANLNLFLGVFTEYAVFNILLFSLVISVFALLKVVFLFLLNALFGKKKFYKVHFFEFVRFFCLFGLGFLFYSEYPTVIVRNLLLVIYVVWVLWLLFEVVRKSNYRKMYLISYLCISEIFPIFILMKQMGEW